MKRYTIRNTLGKGGGAEQRIDLISKMAKERTPSVEEETMCLGPEITTLHPVLHHYTDNLTDELISYVDQRFADGVVGVITGGCIGQPHRSRRWISNNRTEVLLKKEVDWFFAAPMARAGRTI